jgi:hypothetical protein
VLTASAAINYSFERADEKLAIYTQYLVEGIKTGAADRDEDGWVSVDDLHEFMVEKLLKADPRMTPQRYVEKDGGKIILTKAIVSDPMKQYRKFVRKYAKDGVIRRTGKRNLDFERDRLKLSIEDTAAIEADELRLYLEHLKHLKDYEACVEEELELTFPLDDRAREELQDLQKRLNLTADEVKEIEDRVINIKRNQQLDKALEQEKLRISDYHARGEKIFHSKSIAQPSKVLDTPPDRDLVALWQKILSNVEEIPARAILSTNCHIAELNGQEIKIGIFKKSSLAIVKARSAQLGKACAKTLKVGVKMTFIVTEGKREEHLK